MHVDAHCAIFINVDYAACCHWHHFSHNGFIESHFLSFLRLKAELPQTADIEQNAFKGSSHMQMNYNNQYTCIYVVSVFPKTSLRMSKFHF